MIIPNVFLLRNNILRGYIQRSLISLFGSWQHQSQTPITTTTTKNCFQKDKKFSHKMKFMIPKFNLCHLRWLVLSFSVFVSVSVCLSFSFSISEFHCYLNQLLTSTQIWKTSIWYRHTNILGDGQCCYTWLILPYQSH